MKKIIFLLAILISISGFGQVFNFTVVKNSDGTHTVDWTADTEGFQGWDLQIKVYDGKKTAPNDPGIAILNLIRRSPSDPAFPESGSITFTPQYNGGWVNYIGVLCINQNNTWPQPFPECDRKFITIKR